MNDFQLDEKDLGFIYDKRSQYLNQFKKNRLFNKTNLVNAMLNTENQKKYFKVISNKKIKKGDLIEISPMIFLGFRARYHPDPIIVNNLFQVHKECPCLDCKNHGRTIAAVGGYGSFYRKSENPNAIWFDDVESLVWMCIAIKDIEAEEEVFIPPNFKIKENQENKKEKYDIPKTEKDLWDFDWSRIPLTPTD